MKLLLPTAALLATARAIPYALPDLESRSVSAGFSEAEIDWLLERASADAAPAKRELTRRRGGGGGHSSGGSSSGGSKSGGTTSSSGGSTSGGTTSGSTSSGKSIGGGSAYPGGSTTSYTAGSKSPSGIAPALLGGAAVGFALGALYFYPYHTSYSHYNSATHTNQSYPVECVCQPDDPCGCDDTGSQSDIDEMLQNSTIAKIESVNGTQTVVINGTLLNSTSAASALVPQAGWGALSGVAAVAVLLL